MYFALPHFSAEDQITTNAEDNQENNGCSLTEKYTLLADERIEVSIRKQFILGHKSRFIRIQTLWSIPQIKCNHKVVTFVCSQIIKSIRRGGQNSL